jgi:membrane protein
VTATTDGRSGEKPEDSPSTLQQMRAHHPSLDHLARASTRYTEHHGDHYAAAVTFFSVLSLVPLLMITFAVAGYVLFFNPALLDQLRAAITSAIPGDLAGTINGIIDQAIAQRNVVAGLGLLTALYSGIGWMTNLREALSEQWAQPPETPALPRRLFFDLVALLGLGFALLVSFAITGLASSFAADVLAVVGLADDAWAQTLLQVLGILLALTANFLVFLWVIARLPRRHVTLRSAAKAALLGTIGFEVLKRVMTIYLRQVTESPSGAVFGSMFGLLIFIYFASRFVLFVTAWAATAQEVEQQLSVPVPAPAIIRPEVVVRSGPDVPTAAGLVGAGLLTGLLGLRFLHRHRP